MGISLQKVCLMVAVKDGPTGTLQETESEHVVAAQGLPVAVAVISIFCFITDHMIQLKKSLLSPFLSSLCSLAEITHL